MSERVSVCVHARAHAYTGTHAVIVEQFITEQNRTNHV